VLYSEAQYGAEGFPFTPLTPDLEVHWVPGRSLTRDEDVLVPASMVYVNWFTAGYSAAPVTNFCPFAGIAAGPNLDYAIVSGSVGGLYAEPFGTVPPYLTVPLESSNGSATFDLGFAANYFGLYWGSIDSYNSISFYLGGALVSSFTGSDVVMPADGNQTSTDTNRYVSFHFGAMSFDQVVLASNGYAFESDNHAFAKVPEPSILALLGLGLIGLGFARRRQRMG
jgi:hypothetical protein